ncbi:DNA-binding transcriptional LysR family regulator [Prauserella isguenensis]|uniref:DNA-binding transcriptional LysR family regulator n=1 Tax=Prauserella isguenensis TaxID=1470180 RepID=A0A839S7N1_9PSEU|nr:LysR family transcriptional regulator [Prauserella isguenensis]MBB3053392.1 DNA-binding transcriptional LysR family regulator [Prauserella isguenensis]
MDVELRHIRAFAAVAHHGSFTRAAEALLITQPALSRTVAQLEKILGVELLDRSSRRIDLTGPGLEFLGHADQVLAALEQGIAAARKDVTIRLGFSWLLPDPWAQRTVTRFEADVGAAVSLVRSDDPLQALRERSVDVALVRGRIRNAPPASRAVHLYDEVRVAVCAADSALAERERLAWSEVPSWPLVVNTRSGTTGPWSFPDGQGPQRTVETGNFDEWLESVAANRGIGIVPEVAQRRINHPAARFVPLTGAPASPVHLVHLPGGQQEMVNRFLDVAVASARGAPRA